MGDSTEMTIEFLRARLLSERSVSRTARQRADQLAKRVVELEEQLRIVSMQRRKVEKAAAEILAILESQGVDDFSGIFDSSSDHDEDIDTSPTSRIEKTEMEDMMSGSEVQVSPSQGRSLSWKRCSDSPRSRQKLLVKQIKQRQRWSSWLSGTESSPKHRLGKSCRRIKRIEMGSARQDEADKADPGDDERREATSSNNVEVPPDVENELTGALVPASPDEKKESSDGFYGIGGDRDEMERVLEQRDQLIDQYQAEENAQREWEEKYKEKKSSIPNASELRNQHAIVEMSIKPMKQDTDHIDKNSNEPSKETSGSERVLNNTGPASWMTGVSVSDKQKVRSILLDMMDSNTENVAMGISDGLGLTDLTARSTTIDHRHSSPGMQYHRLADEEAEARSQEFAFPAKKSLAISNNRKQDSALFYDKSDSDSHSNSSLQPHGRLSLGGRSTRNPSFDNSVCQLSKCGSSEIQRRPLQTSSNNLGGVLNSLQHAKSLLSLQLQPSPYRSQGTLAVASQTCSEAKPESLSIPVGSARLFRLPTDSFPQDDFLNPRFYSSGLTLSSPAYADVGPAISTYPHQYPSTSYVEAGPRVSVGKQYYDPCPPSVRGLPSSSRLAALASSFVTEEVSFQNEFSRLHLDSRSEMSARYPSLYASQNSQFDPRMALQRL